MTANEFAKLVGPHLLHVTPRANASSIAAQGLRSAATLAMDADVDPDSLILRKDRRILETPQGTVQLNHQRPLRSGRMSADTFLEGHTIESWAAQLDTRMFFWPTRKGQAFSASMGAEATQYMFDSVDFFNEFAPHIALSPINSGNATRRPAQRGDWLYVGVDEPVATFLENRRKRGLIKGRDSVAEVSITCHVTASQIADLSR